MGTVGLSFGSPTSGAGFDVSTTVASIVGNLRNVETPWKTQLTSLESQDTAISSLGTIFSNLSNDLSSLTDLQGILSEKTGSSSDTNVLTLTAANSTAVAGTHTVEVTNLATTSSGYLAAVPSASTKLSGSITLQVGVGDTPQTITLNSSDNTLSGLASAINASGAGVTASVLTDASGSRLSLVSGTSGANGNIIVSANSINAALTYTGTAATSTTNYSGTIGEIKNAADVLSGSLSIQVGNGTAQNIAINSSDNTVAGLASAINTAAIGVTASVVTNGDGTSSLSLVSQTAGTAGTLTVNANVLDTATSARGYTTTVTGKNANLTVDGVALTSASNTVANLIPGVTFQLLAPSATESDGSLEQVQVVIGNDNAQVESTVSQFVSDYNSLITAMNTQEGNTSSGTPEPLFGSPTLSLLQQQLMGGLNLQNPNGYLTSVSNNTNTTLSGSMSITVGNGTKESIVIGAAPSTPAANTIYTGSGVNTLAGVASAISAANIGVTATVVTTGNQASLSLLSQTAGSSGALTVSTSLAATSDSPLGFTTFTGYSSQPSTGTSTGLQNANDVLTGSVAITVGNGAMENVVIGAAPSSPAANTIYTGSGVNTLAGIASAISAANIGVTASVVTNSDGTSSLQVVSGTAGSPGNLTLNSSLLDSTNTTSSPLSYTSSSDVSGLTSLGISVNNNGTLTLDAGSLDSLLNTDYSGVVGFFQNANSWGQTFSNILTNAGNGSATGVLSLAEKSNSNIEATLNANISKEETLISAEQKSLTAELNSANELMQALPSQLQGVNELYSAITGYNQNRGG
jgi:flagellar hook-associated protein 2